MTPKRWLSGTVVFFVAAATACLDMDGPAAPDLYPVTPSNPVSPSPLPPPVRPSPPPPFPAVPNGTVVYEGPEDLYDFILSYHGSKLPTRYLFFADSTFQLQFASYRFGIFQYAGRYSRSDSVFTFTWEGWSTAGPWGASATLRGDTLDVRYNDIMNHSDFVDGRYTLVR